MGLNSHDREQIVAGLVRRRRGNLLTGRNRLRNSTVTTSPIVPITESGPFALLHRLVRQISPTFTVSKPLPEPIDPDEGRGLVGLADQLCSSAWTDPVTRIGPEKTLLGANQESGAALGEGLDGGNGRPARTRPGQRCAAALAEVGLTP